LDALKPSVKENVERNQLRQQACFRGNRKVVFEASEPVLARDYSTNTWRNATVVTRCSPVTYIVKTNDMRMWKRHVDQLKPRCVTGPKSVTSEECAISDANPAYQDDIPLELRKFQSIR